MSRQTAPTPDATGLQLAGRTALVTGASGALGRSICRVFRDRGASVVGVDIDDCDVQADISTSTGNRAAIDAVLSEHGRLDILVLNAGVQHMAPLPEFPEHAWRQLMDVMLTGPFLTIKHAWGSLVERPGGRILVTASTSSYVAEPYKAAYVAAKHGVLGLVKVAALEGAAHGLTANAVAPSWMRTPMVERQVDDRVRLLNIPEQEVVEQLVAEHAVKRFVEPDEVAELLAFLASPASSAITGACVPVDLGALA